MYNEHCMVIFMSYDYIIYNHFIYQHFLFASHDYCITWYPILQVQNPITSCAFLVLQGSYLGFVFVFCFLNDSFFFLYKLINNVQCMLKVIQSFGMGSWIWFKWTYWKHTCTCMRSDNIQWSFVADEIDWFYCYEIVKQLTFHVVYIVAPSQGQDIN